MPYLEKYVANLHVSLIRSGIRWSTLVCVMLVSMLTFSISSSEQTIDVQKMSVKAPKETMHFGRIVGQWSIKDQSLGKDGKWQDGPGADWNFYWILGGNAIQDDWISPGFAMPAPEAGRQLGTNIRIYNPKEKVWDMAWMSNSGRKLDTFKATSDDKSIIMSGIYSGQETQITFFNISEKRFSWKMEKLDKTSKQWSPIYKIEAYRIMK